MSNVKLYKLSKVIVFMKPIKTLQIGKNGLSETFISQARRVFEDAEVVKISILKSACRDKTQAKEMADKLMEALGKNFGYRLVGYVLTVRKFRKVQR